MAGTKFFLRATPDRPTINRIEDHMTRFGHGEVTFQEEGKFTVLYVRNSNDAALVRNTFGDLIDAWADLTE